MTAAARDPVVRAFDAAAAGYDRDWGTNPVGRLFRWAVQERLAALFPPGARVLDLGCGTGEDAVFLGARGVQVEAVDAAPAMVALTQAKAVASGVGDRVRAWTSRLEDLEVGVRPVDGAFSNFGALNAADRPTVARRLAAVLRPGAPVLLCVMGAHPLPLILERGLRGRARREDGPVSVQGVAIPVTYPGLAGLRRDFDAGFLWRRAWGLGVLVPDPGHRQWVQDHPQGFGVLAALESLVAHLPGVRAMGDHVVVEGVRA